VYKQRVGKRKGFKNLHLGMLGEEWWWPLSYVPWPCMFPGARKDHPAPCLSGHWWLPLQPKDAFNDSVIDLLRLGGFGEAAVTKSCFNEILVLGLQGQQRKWSHPTGRFYAPCIALDCGKDLEWTSLISFAHLLSLLESLIQGLAILPSLHVLVGRCTFRDRLHRPCLDWGNANRCQVVCNKSNLLPLHL
jgi:hypothetical protein